MRRETISCETSMAGIAKKVILELLEKSPDKTVTRKKAKQAFMRELHVCPSGEYSTICSSLDRALLELREIEHKIVRVERAVYKLI